jgi:uncharacterized protein (DUF4415 family)
MKNDGNIKKFSPADLQARRARGESRTDFVRVKAKSNEELERDIASDPDFSDIPETWYETAEAVVPTPKKLLSLRIDNEVIDWFKEQGPGYQTRMNAVLREFVAHKVKHRTD